MRLFTSRGSRNGFWRATRYISDLRPGDVITRRTVHSCAACRRLFFGRRDAIYCCDACKMRAHRKSQKSGETK